MTFNSSTLQFDANRVREAFIRVHDEVFRDDPLTNPNLEVEVLEVGELSGDFGTQSVLILITPWAINGMVLPGRGLPSAMQTAEAERTWQHVELPETGPYAQITLVSDVAKYTTQAQARTIAESMVPVLAAGVAAQVS